MSESPGSPSRLLAVVLCHDEEPNIRRCLESVAGWCPLFVVDSGSTDRTREICAEFTPHVVVHPYANHAAQWQWALDHLPIDGDWVLALDADFVVTPELRAEIDRRLPGLPERVAGGYVRHRYVFGGCPIRFGGTKHDWLRLVRRGRARPDLSDLVDFRFVVDGEVAHFRGWVVEENRHDEDLSVWLRKQDKFALRLAVEEELRRAGLNRWQGRPRLLGLDAKRDQPAGSLTLPERKRLEVARALATGPRLLLLDEVMAGLRPTEVDQMVGVFRRLNEGGLTILLIEHVMRAVMALAQRVVVLNHGETIAAGTPEQVVRDPAVLECYLGEEAV